MAQPPSLTPEQRAAALEKAAEARRVRAEVKMLLKLNRITLAELFERADTDDVVAKLKVVSVLESLPGVGKVRARRTMTELEIADNRRLRGVGANPRTALLDAFAEREGCTLAALLVLAGPSGVGKGTVVRHLLAEDPNLWLSVSAATRPMRPGEVDGVDYFFMDRAEFERVRDAGGFLEWFEVYGDLKGTPRAAVEEHLMAGLDVLLEIDVQGALSVQERFPDAVLVFLRPPSREEQRRRLEGRAVGDPVQQASIEQRLAEAEAEELLAARFDHVVTNHESAAAAAEVAAILRGRRSGDAPSGS
ncbi:MAG: guanylate kinase [Actinomycetes bacterium]